MTVWITGMHVKYYHISLTLIKNSVGSVEENMAKGIIMRYFSYNEKVVFFCFGGSWAAAGCTLCVTSISYILSIF